MPTKPPTKSAPPKPPTKSTAPPKPSTESPSSQPNSATPAEPSPEPSDPSSSSETESEATQSESSETPEHPAGQAIPLSSDPSADRLQEEQDELQQPGRVSRAVADQIDNDPGYSKDQLAHMKEYWGHGDAVGEDEEYDEDDTRP